MSKIMLQIGEEEYRKLMAPYVASITYVELSINAAKDLNEPELFYKIKQHQIDSAILIIEKMLSKIKDNIKGAEDLIVSYHSDRGYVIVNSKTNKTIDIGRINFNSSDIANQATILISNLFRGLELMVNYI